MTEAVVAVDMGNEGMDRDVLNEWLDANKYEYDSDYITSDQEQISYSYYDRVGVIMFKFDNSDDYFPTVVIDYIHALKDDEGTNISVAEDGEYGYETLIESSLGDFRDTVLVTETSDSEDNLFVEFISHIEEYLGAIIGLPPKAINEMVSHNEDYLEGQYGAGASVEDTVRGILKKE